MAGGGEAYRGRRSPQICDETALSKSTNRDNPSHTLNPAHCRLLSRLSPRLWHSHFGFIRHEIVLHELKHMAIDCAIIINEPGNESQNLR